jgi:hypothetical protein
LASPDCAYGTIAIQYLERYISGIMTSAGVPPRHTGNFTAFRSTEAIKEALRWPVRGFLILTGANGSGKSFAAAYVLREYLRGRIADPFDRGTWESAERAGGNISWSDAAGIAGDRTTAERAKRGYPAVIDDFGGGNDFHAEQTGVTGVLSSRYDSKLPTVITTTLSMLDIAARYGSRVFDTLTEDIGSGGMIVDCGGASMRASFRGLAGKS